MIETSGTGTLYIVAIMVIITLATRWGGVYFMSVTPINYRVRQFIQAMSASVLVALIAPMAITGDHGARIALLATAVIIFLTQKPLPAITAGIVAAALTRQFVY